MKNEPYEKFINMFRQEGSSYNPPQMRLGTVVSVTPLVIKTGELQLTKEDILVNSNITDISVDFTLDNTKANGNACEGSISSIEIPNGTMKLKSILKENDVVALQPISDCQTWIILCKVVRG